MKKLLFILILLFSYFSNSIGQEVYATKIVADFFGEEVTSLTPTRVIINDSTIAIYEKGKKPDIYSRTDTEPQSCGNSDKCVELTTGSYGYETVYLCYKDINKFFEEEEYYLISFRVTTTRYACRPQAKGCIIWHHDANGVQETISYWKEL